MFVSSKLKTKLIKVFLIILLGVLTYFLFVNYDALISNISYKYKQGNNIEWRGNRINLGFSYIAKENEDYLNILKFKIPFLNFDDLIFIVSSNINDRYSILNKYCKLKASCEKKKFKSFELFHIYSSESDNTEELFYIFNLKCDLSLTLTGAKDSMKSYLENKKLIDSIFSNCT